MKRLFSCAAILGGLLSVPVQAQVMLSIDGQPAVETESEITSIVYKPAQRRLEVRTAWDDLRCVPNPDGPNVTLPIPQPGVDFVFALDQLPGDVDGEYVIESDGSIAQLAAAIGGDPTTLSIVTSDSRINNCNGADCAVLVCAPGGTPIFSGDFEPIAADLGVRWDTVPVDGPLEIVAGDASGTIIALTARNTGSLDATAVTVDVDVATQSGSIPCPTVVSGGNGFSFDGSCSGTWTIGDLASGGESVMELRYTADATASNGALASSDALIDSPTVADINPQDNSAAIDLEVVKETRLLIATDSIPSTPLDLNAGPDSFVFEVDVTPQGPSTLNEPVVFDITFPPGGDYDVQITDPDYNALDGTWSPLVGSSQLALFGTVTVNSYEPGSANFCFGVDSFAASSPQSTVTVNPASSEIMCLDVDGPETIDLTAQATADATVVAGSASGINPGNLVQTIELSNNNATFDASNVDALITLDLPAGVTLNGTPSVSLGNISEVNGDWQWTISTLPAGQTATADFWYDVSASTADSAQITTTMSSVTIDPGQILANPVPSTPVTTDVDREIDLVVTSGESADPVAPGGALVYVFQVANAGPSNASAITLDFDEVLPVGVSITSVAPNFLGSFSNGVWTIPTLSVNAAIAPALTVTIDVGTGAVPGNAISGTVTVSGSNETRINTGNDSSAETTLIQ
jgi:hypothetical protein